MRRQKGEEDTLKVWLTDSTPGFREVAERIMGREGIDVSLVDSDYCSEGLCYSACDCHQRNE
jgi:hypothetical protein